LIEATTLLDAATAVLNAGAPPDKTAAAARAQRLLAKGASLGEQPESGFPARPARPAKPLLAPPSEVPRRRLGCEAGRAALLHAIAHIEFNAIDLAFDMAARFAGEIRGSGLDAQAFVADWIGVGADEARHFTMISQRLGALGAEYGDFPAHGGLWEAAENTAGSVAARLAVAPLILEARGLDVTPNMVRKLTAAGDRESAAILQIIYDEEIGHVGCGKRWFHAICIAEGREPAARFHALKARYFQGVLKPPFNYAARDKAGLPRAFYEPK